jgi:ferrous iron transport protein B
LLSELDTGVKNDYKRDAYKRRYTPESEQAIAMIEPCLMSDFAEKIDCRWLSLRLLEDDKNFLSKIFDFLNCDIFSDENISKAVNIAKNFLQNQGIMAENLKDLIVTQIVKQAESICDGIYKKSDNYSAFDRKLDRVLTSRLTGYPIMLLLLILIFWITISGANYPSQLLSNLFLKGQELLTDLFSKMAAPDWLHGVLVLGVYRVLTWVVAVMLPPMAIFFPLFTLLEDLGYLPRVAYNLDKPFKRCSACGKQALTMCMGFGCNAAGVVGCRIIDSPRERLLAILTNNFVPCNGRFPTIISIISMFFIGSVAGGFSTFLSAVVLTAVILLGVAATFFVTEFLSTTLLKGVPSSFILEMPSFRRPQISKVIVRSIFDRTVFVLGRAVAVAAPAGVLIWLMANINIGEQSALRYFAEFLDPFAKLMGIDGIILIAFILGFPANEIVVPIMLMAYLSEGSLLQINDISVLKQVLVDNGWTIKTAVSVVLFSLMHWPCSTTLITIKKETGSIKWTLLSVLIPTIIGICVCMLFNAIASIFV